MFTEKIGDIVLADNEHIVGHYGDYTITEATYDRKVLYPKLRKFLRSSGHSEISTSVALASGA